MFYLEVAEFVDAYRWRWILKDSHQVFLADHQIAIEKTDSLYAAFLNLYEYLKTNVIPDKWPDDEIRLLRRVGTWIADEILGAIAQRLIAETNPATVLVLLSPKAAGLMYSPLDIARLNDRSLAERDVSFVFEITGEQPSGAKAPIGEKLRMLATFSLPTDVSALALRRERYELKRLITRISQTHNIAVELRVLQYGTTKRALQDVLEEGEGWDIIHFSGHGMRAGLVLEKLDGTHDLLTGGEFAQLLQTTRGQLKLITLSSCFSGAATVRETMQWLGLKASAAPNEELPRGELVALARELVRQLGCAVVAMRYPVGDDFAVAFGSEIYDKLLGKRQPLTRAFQLALRSALSVGYRPGLPPVSVATPTLFGEAAVQLSLQAPPSVAEPLAPENGFSSIPHEKAHFVGRIGPMSRASAAMAPESGKLGVLFHGMAGAGKTYCAVELAHRYEFGRFQHFIWYKAPDEGNDIAGELQKLASKLESGVPGLKIVGSVNDANEFSSALPSLRRALEQRSVLLVLDNLESLLTTEGTWRDSRWKELFDTLLGHNGNSRIVVTSRRRPSGDGYSQAMSLEAIDVLSLSESVLLAHELPNLGRLLRGHPAVSLQAGRQLVQRVLSLVQGHPQLIDFAEAEAVDPEGLALKLDRAAAAWDVGEQALRVFFETGESSLKESAFLTALNQWTHEISGSLPGEARLLLHFLCSIEESDRDSRVLVDIWPAFVKRYDPRKEAPDIEVTLKPLKTTGLLQEESIGGGFFQYSIHPAVVAAAKSEVGQEFTDLVDSILSQYWVEVFNTARDQELEGFGRHIIRAGLSAAPYLIRRQEWFAAAQGLESVISRDGSPGTLAAVIPLQRRIVEHSKGSKDELRIGVSFSNALLAAGLITEAQEMSHQLLKESEDRGDYRAAVALAGQFAETLSRRGEFERAAEFREKELNYLSRTDLGPWSELMVKARILRELNAQGAYLQVFSTLRDSLWPYVNELPEHSGQTEAVEPWQVKENIYDIEHSALLGLEEWQAAIDLNSGIQALMISRGASDLDIANVAFNDYSPLLRLGRIADARSLLGHCRDVAEGANDLSLLGKIFSALSSVEYQAENFDQSIELEETALRYKYLTPNAETCGLSHFNLANRLFYGAQFEKSLAHRLAATLIAFQMSSGSLANRLQYLRLNLEQVGPELPPFSTSFDQLAAEVEKVQGVKFRSLCEALPRRFATEQENLAAVLMLAGHEIPTTVGLEQLKEVGALSSGNSESHEGVRAIGFSLDMPARLLEDPPSPKSAASSIPGISSEKLGVTVSQRYLAVRADDRVRVGVPFMLTARISSDDPNLQPGQSGSAVTGDVSGKIKISIYAPGFAAKDDIQREIEVPPTGNSPWAPFELSATKIGLQQIDVLAWRNSVQVGGVTIAVDVGAVQPKESSVQGAVDIREPEVGEYTLEIVFERSLNKYRFQLRTDTGDNWPSMYSDALEGTKETEYANVTKALNSQARNANSLSAYAQGEWLKGMGAILYSQLVPSDLKQALWENRNKIKYLNILSAAEPMPWELLYVSDPSGNAEGEFIADTATVTRWRYGPPAGRRFSKKVPYFVLPDGSPTKARDEVTYARQKVGSGTTIDKLDDLLRLLNGGQFSLLHFASHNVTDPTASAGLYIPFGNSKFDITFMGAWGKDHFRSNSPLVFMNSCTSGGGVPLYTGMAGWADNFLRAGCGAFIGALWEIRDSSALAFSEKFYDEVTSGKNFGDSMRAARNVLKGTDPTYLAYTLYGNPLAQIL